MLGILAGVRLAARRRAQPARGRPTRDAAAGTSTARRRPRRRRARADEPEFRGLPVVAARARRWRTVGLLRRAQAPRAGAAATPRNARGGARDAARRHARRPARRARPAPRRDRGLRAHGARARRATACRAAQFEAPLEYLDRASPRRCARGYPSARAARVRADAPVRAREVQRARGRRATMKEDAIDTLAALRDELRGRRRHEPSGAGARAARRHDLGGRAVALVALLASSRWRARPRLGARRGRAAAGSRSRTASSPGLRRLRRRRRRSRCRSSSTSRRATSPYDAAQRRRARLAPFVIAARRGRRLLVARALLGEELRRRCRPARASAGTRRGRRAAPRGGAPPAPEAAPLAVSSLLVGRRLAAVLRAARRAAAAARLPGRSRRTLSDALDDTLDDLRAEPDAAARDHARLRPHGGGARALRLLAARGRGAARVRRARAARARGRARAGRAS